MANLFDTSNLGVMPHSDPKFSISPSMIDSAHQPLFQQLGLPGNDEPLFPPLPQMQSSSTRPSSTINPNTKRSRRPSKSPSQNDEISTQRAKHLERNRIAANKCRIKKKKEHQQIQYTLHDESARRDSLLAEVGCLKEEIWRLKNQVFSHVQCEDHQMNTQLARMTQGALQSSSGPAQCPSPTFSLSTQSDGSSGIESGLGPLTQAYQAPEETVYDDDLEPLFDKFIEAGDV